MFALIDCNTFYASCEAIFNPALRGKPVVVLSNNDGCIISCNREAKALNIPCLAPFHEVRRQVEAVGCHVFSSNYELYGDISARVMRLLREQSVAMEVYSIDEAFLLLPHGDHQAHGMVIKKLLWQQVRMPVCVGIAPTKTLAKLASKAAKNISKLNGVCMLDRSEKWEWLLARAPTNDIWGIGSRLSTRLQQLGIHNALQLAKSNPKMLRRHFSVVLEKVIRELNGAACLDLEIEPSPKHEIICSRSFSYKVTELRELQQAASLYTAQAAEKMRRQNSLTQHLCVYIENSRAGGSEYFHRHNFVKLPHLSNDTRLLAASAAKAIEAIYRPGIRYKKCGIGLLDLCTRKYEQLHLFASQQSEQSHKLMQVMDKVNQRYGQRSLQFANTGIRPTWTMNRNYLSPAYTTRWPDIPLVRC